MNQPAAADTPIRPVDAHDAQQALMQARAMYQRTLGAWVCDLLHLRQSGRRQPHWSTTDTTTLRFAA
jgi:hypothetical protein